MESKLVSGIMLLRLKWNFSVTSWGRTFARNKMVGGVANSDHLLWNAMDVVLDEGGPNVQFENDAKRCGLKALWDSTHYHMTMA